MGFVVVLVTLLLLYPYLVGSPQVEEPCRLHNWVYRPVDDTDPDSETYLVCSDCKKLPGGMREEFYKSHKKNAS